MVEFLRAEILLGVLTKYKILGFCGLGLNRLKFYQTKTWDIMSKNQISADNDILRISKFHPYCRYAKLAIKNPGRNDRGFYTGRI
jgi:hypothetical protein